MKTPLTVLITDGNAKHSIALQRYLRKSMPDLRLVAHAPGRFPFCRLQDGAQEIVGGTLAHILQQRNFDLIIPIGGASARLVAETCPERAVIAPIDKLDMCLNKSNVMALADRLDVPHPRSWVVHSIEEVDGGTVRVRNGGEVIMDGFSRNFVPARFTCNPGHSMVRSGLAINRTCG